MEFWKNISEGEIDALEEHWEKNKPHLALLNELKLEGPSVLDICCGTGQFYGYLSARFKDYVGVDTSEKMLARARARHPKGKFFVRDMYAMGGLTADTVFCWSVLIHYPYLKVFQALKCLRDPAKRRIVFNFYLTDSDTKVFEKASMAAPLLFANEQMFVRDMSTAFPDWEINKISYHKPEHFKNLKFQRAVIICTKLK